MKTKITIPILIQREKENEEEIPKFTFVTMEDKFYCCRKSEHK